MRVLLAITSIALASTIACADSIVPVPTQGSPLSAIYGIGDVHEARTLTDIVRAYRVSYLKGKSLSDSVLLQAISDNRTPDQSKLSRVLVWNLGHELREVRGITIDGTKVSIRGWSYTQGDLVCTYFLQFKDGVLSDALDSRGCR